MREQKRDIYHTTLYGLPFKNNMVFNGNNKFYVSRNILTSSYIPKF